MLFVFGILIPGRLAAQIEYNEQVPQLAFAVQEITGALKEAGQENLQVSLVIEPDLASPEAFQIRSLGPKRVEVSGSDATGEMHPSANSSYSIFQRIPLKKTTLSGKKRKWLCH